MPGILSSLAVYLTMCGRFTYLYQWKQLQKLLLLTSWPDVELSPHFNVAPTQAAPVVRQIAEGQRTGAMLHWGLIPSWADDPAIGGRLINARAETIAEKPAFRSAFTKRRCLAPVSGFYEWKKQELPKAPKQPFYIARADREPLMLAGVWEHWERGGEAIDSFTIITTTPNAIMAELHDRMPVIVESEDVDRWLDPETTDAAAFTSILRPAADGVLEAIPVRTRVNTPKNDDPSLILPEVEPPQGLFGQ